MTTIVSISQALRELVSRLTPGEGERETWSRIRTLLTERLRSKLPLKELVPRGPLARNTDIKPVADTEFLVVLELDEHATSTEQAVAAVFEAANLYFNEVRRKSRSVALFFAEEGLTVDLIPAVAAGHQHFMVATPEGWRLSDPRGRDAALDRADDRAGGMLRPLLRLVQQWTRVANVPLSADGIESLAGRAFTEAPADLPAGMRALFLHLAGAVLDPDPGAKTFDDEAASSPERLSLVLWSAAEQVQLAALQETAGYIQESHRSLRELFGEPYPVAPAEPDRVLLALDVYDDIAIEDIEPNLPASRSPLTVVRLTNDCGGPRVTDDTLTAAEWDQLAPAVVRMLEQAQSLRHKDGPPVDFFLFARAPLPALVQLGMGLSPTAGRQSFVERHEDGSWSLLPLCGRIDPRAPAYFGVVRGLKRPEPSHTRGRLALFVGKGYPLPILPITDFFEEIGEDIAGVVEIRPEQPNIQLTPQNSPSAAVELLYAFLQLRTVYAGANGIALFVATRSAIAFMAGRALDPGLLGSVLTTTYDRQGGYDLALVLPWRGSLQHRSTLRLILKRLSLSGYRGLGEQELTFDPTLNVLIGENGTGKTSVLDAIAVLLSHLIGDIADQDEERYFRTEDIATDQELLRAAVTMAIDDEEFTWTQSHARGLQAPPPVDAHLARLELRLREAVRDDTRSLPLAVYYSVDRAHLDLSRLPVTTPDGRQSVYHHALTGGGADFNVFFAWFKEQEDLENAERRNNAAFENRLLLAARRAIERLLGEGFTNPRVRRSPLRLVIDKRGRELSLDQLSDGERSLLALAGDLARRLTEANPALVDPLLGSAIVLIDELELHLHPAWQRRIVPDLLRTFPNCQFVATTHSPQVLGHVPAENVHILRWDDGRIVQSRPDASYGWDSNRILEDVLGVLRQPKEVRDRFDRLYSFIDDGALDQARTLRDELARDIGGDYPEFVRIDMLLRRREQRP